MFDVDASTLHASQYDFHDILIKREVSLSSQDNDIN